MKFDAQGIRLQSGFGPPKDSVTSAFNLCPSSAGAERYFKRTSGSGQPETQKNFLNISKMK
jgi:hypothetical protein